MTDYADLTKFIAERIVSDKDAVVVQTQPRGRSTIVRLQVADSDMGKVIGKSGRNIEAIRAVVRAAGLRHHERVQVELKDQK
ncbi:MAG: KH domain-containing protein [Candidatus Dormibacteraeota bacterium]|nr:KH domain-containing protein [Candidatus Dormibacteraeota bacterium]MBV9524265.1 KH domain-containing protein [Candidatus Dormibacteraeota bacterium]